MGNVTGVLSFLTWMVHALVQEPIGRWIDRHAQVFAGHVPGRADAAIGLLAVVLLWNPVVAAYVALTTRICI